MKIITTQRPFNRYRGLFRALDQYVTVEDYNGSFDCDMLFHCPTTFRHLAGIMGKDIDEYRAKLEEQIHEVDCVKDADIYPGDAYNSIRNIVPVVEQLPILMWDGTYPAVIKKKHSSGGRGIICIDNHDQFRKLFDPDAIADSYFKDILPTVQLDPIDYTISRYRDCPGDRYTHYRTVTLGDGSILGSALLYSGHRKGQYKVSDEIWDMPNTPFYLNRRHICSNYQQGGGIIPLDTRNVLSRFEQGILHDHGIKGARLPDRVRELSTQTAQLLSVRGLYVLGQDWIQEGDTYTLLEVNRYPGFDMFGFTHHYDIEHTLDYMAKEIVRSIGPKPF